jgi:cytochrome c oxidase subunit 2
VATPGASPFGAPVDERVRELAPGKYEAYILAQTWVFQPNEVRIPAGSEITFYLTSKDVQHGFNLEGTNINMQILPGQVSTLTATFNEPGERFFICHEYCGVGH